ncbi:MAG TPA: SDR family NAD(P)-dependent oxidoreductase [Candidatus Paceibacterota bacterium]|nr:SDR family NAD(P)-dependent oxidoreductase [Candidatus Paceibacterota bacterium]
MKAFVTGGAGFIGSHIVDRLIERGDEVVVYDNMSTGIEDFVSHHFKNPRFKFIQADILDSKKLTKEIKGMEIVFHLAAHADVRSGFIDHKIDLEQNLLGTINVLEAMHNNNVKKIAFASTSSVYGDATVIPTPEDYPFSPTSLYGSSKASAETYISTFCEYYDMTAYIFRFVSWVGERYTHGLVFDFLNKLKKDPTTLHILGDGTQKKSYLYVKDGVNAIFTIIEKAKEKMNIYNLGNDEIINVADSAKVILDEAKYNNVKLIYGEGDKGWIGDNKYVLLDTKKLQLLGWKASKSTREGLRITTRYLLNNQEVIEKRNNKLTNNI